MEQGKEEAVRKTRQRVKKKENGYTRKITGKKMSHRSSKVGKRGYRKETRERRLRILNSIRRYGRMSFDKWKWAEKEKVSIKTIEKDMGWLKDNVIIDVIDVEKIMYDANDGYEKLIQQARKQAQDKTLMEKDRRAWANTYDKLILGRTRTIEDYGAKEKVGEKLTVEGEGLITPEKIRLAYEERRKK